MNSRAAMFAQAARGPLLLITVGILFALQQADVISIWRTWPLLIIVIGVMKLIERMLGPRLPLPVGPAFPAYQPPNAPYAGPGAPGGPPPGGPVR